MLWVLKLAHTKRVSTVHIVLFALALSTFTQSALASGAINQSRQKAALRMIQAGYSPAIRARSLGADLNATECKIEKFAITGQDPIDGAPRDTEVVSYLGLYSAAQKRAIVIVPSIVGTSLFERENALMFCRAGFHAIVIDKIERDGPVSLELNSYDRVTLRKLSAIRHVTNWAYEKGAQHAGILGTSAGGLISSLALGIEPKLKAGALIAAGADLSEIVVDSAEESQAELRSQRMQKYGFRNREDYLGALKRSIVINNLDFVDYSGRKPTWMAVITNDTVVPTRTQLALKKALGPKSGVEYSGDHIRGIIKTNLWSKPEILDFFRQSLKMPGAVVSPN